MSQFKRDMTERMRDPEYAYEFGRTERELEIVEIVAQFAKCDECDAGSISADCSPKLAQHIISLIKGETK